MRNIDSVKDQLLVREIERILKLYHVSPPLVPKIVAKTTSDPALKELVALFIESPW
jgi:hypothetical protein